MADDSLLSKIHDLSDLELGALICLIAREHCIIDTEPDALDDLIQELELVVEKAFGLTHAVIDCSEHTSLDDFAHAIVAVDVTPSRSNSPVITRQESSYFLQAPSFQSISRSPTSENHLETKMIANVVIAKNLDAAPKHVQIQALELLRARRIYTRTSVQHAPKTFLFLAVLAGGDGPRLTKHLNDHMFISHFHDPEDGFPNTEDMYGDGSSISSVVKKGPSNDPEALLWPRISEAEIEVLVRQSEQSTVSVEVKQYQHNIISFLRLHRAVAGGISAIATKHFDKLAKCLSPLHGISYATPSLIALAARKIYLHRIQIVTPDKERSMQWGSDVAAISELLDGVGPEDVIEDVLGSSGPEVDFNGNQTEATLVVA